MPRPPRFFITPDQISGSLVTLTGEDAHHIAVMRMKAGDELLLGDGQGTDYAVRIDAAGKAEVRTTIMSSISQELRLPRITLGQGIAKADKMDWIVQKATELGVSRIVPLVTERTIVKVRDEEKKIARWRKISREAAMQSNRPDIPLISEIVSFSAFIRALASDPGTLLVFPWEKGTEPVKNILHQDRPVGDVVVLIGPEGGFSQAEADLAQGSGFLPVSLGKNILRTETAAVACLSMISYEFSK